MCDNPQKKGVKKEVNMINQLFLVTITFFVLQLSLVFAQENSDCLSVPTKEIMKKDFPEEESFYKNFQQESIECQKQIFQKIAEDVDRYETDSTSNGDTEKSFSTIIWTEFDKFKRRASSSVDSASDSLGNVLFWSVEKSREAKNSIAESEEYLQLKKRMLNGVNSASDGLDKASKWSTEKYKQSKDLTSKGLDKASKWSIEKYKQSKDLTSKGLDKASKWSTEKYEQSKDLPAKSYDYFRKRIDRLLSISESKILALVEKVSSDVSTEAGSDCVSCVEDDSNHPKDQNIQNLNEAINSLNKEP